MGTQSGKAERTELVESGKEEGVEADSYTVGR